MGISTSLIPAHDDALHSGNAKRGVPNGLASLDAAGKVPVAQVGAVELTTNKNAASGYAGLDASVLLALTQQRLNFKIGSFTRDTSIATGTQAVTGVGFVPRLVIFIATTPGNVGEMCIGIDDGTIAKCVYDSYQTVANQYQSPNFSLYLQGTVGIFYYGNIQSLDADGFTVSWNKIGAKTGTATILYIALR